MTTTKALPESFLRARRALLLDHPFFGSLILHLEPVIDTTQETIWVDGRKLGFNPALFDTLTIPEGAGVLAHEVLHCALEHHLRRGSRNHELWNTSCDYVINPIVRKSGLPLPTGVLENPQYDGKAAEEVYHILNTQKPQPEDWGGGPNLFNTPSNGQGEGTGQNSPQNASQPLSSGSQPSPGAGSEGIPAPGTGEVRDAAGEGGGQASPAEAKEQAENWKVRVQQAVNNAKGQGFFPADLDRFVGGTILTYEVPWKELTRRWFQSIGQSDISWSRPNRHVAELPGLRSQAAGTFVLGVDSSGSIGERLMSQFAGHVSEILEDVHPERLIVLYSDAQVHTVEEFTVSDMPLTLHPKGGGGTDFRPVFDWVEANGVSPDCVIYLTDMMGSFPQADPDYPTLWCSTSYIQKAPFGDVVNIKEQF